jgi:hypothetical protein
MPAAFLFEKPAERPCADFLHDFGPGKPWIELSHIEKKGHAVLFGNLGPQRAIQLNQVSDDLAARRLDAELYAFQIDPENARRSGSSGERRSILADFVSPW